MVFPSLWFEISSPGADGRLSSGHKGPGDAIQTPIDIESHGKATLQLQTRHSARSALPPPDHPLFNGSSPPVLAMLCFLLCILNPLLGSQPQAARGKQLGGKKKPPLNMKSQCQPHHLHTLKTQRQESSERRLIWGVGFLPLPPF